jgi:hypothetical protein
VTSWSRRRNVTVTSCVDKTTSFRPLACGLVVLSLGCSKYLVGNILQNYFFCVDLIFAMMFVNIKPANVKVKGCYYNSSKIINSHTRISDSSAEKLKVWHIDKNIFWGCHEWTHFLFGIPGFWSDFMIRILQLVGEVPRSIDFHPFKCKERLKFGHLKFSLGIYQR